MIITANRRAPSAIFIALSKVTGVRVMRQPPGRTWTDSGERRGSQTDAGSGAKSLNHRGGATVRTRLVLIDGYKATDVRSGSPESASGAVGGH